MNSGAIKKKAQQFYSFNIFTKLQLYRRNNE